jgi:hypothetical protein
VSDAASSLPAERIARVAAAAEIPAALRSLGVPPGRPVLVVVGGAGGMTPDDLIMVARVLEDLAPALDRGQAVVVDGGTDSGVMRAMGHARSAAGASFPLVGVAAEGTIALPGRPSAPDAAALDRHHTHAILVPGTRWGDESPWLARVATQIAGGQPSVTLAINGGEITYDDVWHSLEDGRPVIVLAGTGRTADAIAAAADGQPADGPTDDPRAAKIAASPNTRIVPLGDPPALRLAVESVLAPRG